MKKVATGTLVLLLCSALANAQQALHHDLEVMLDPAQNSIAVTDTITLAPQTVDQREFTFHLNERLILNSLQGENFRIDEIPIASADGAADAGREIAPSKRYRLTVSDDSMQVSLTYSGQVYTDLEQLTAEYAQSFSSTTGIIGEQGVYLDHSSVWVPDFQSGLMNFSMEVDFANNAHGWTSVSQGDSHGRENFWVSEQPMEEVYLIAAEFTVYRNTVHRAQSGEVETLAYLRQPDVNLATRYLDATERYLALYEPMLGEYPFSKFALVENFWETGYGMPSFTLLGEQIIRFPFILESSYPHEILHNWWGNSVYPDYETGNWSEGLTAYLADHLFQEMNGSGGDYRKDMLGRYRSFVTDAADFPLSQFTSRNSAASQAIGYGKTLMLWHMLRVELGDEQFLEALRALYTERRFTRTSFADIEAIFSRISGKDLGSFFTQWVERAGAPELSVRVTEAGDSAQIMLQQVQQGEPYTLSVPIALYYEGATEAEIVNVEMNGVQAQISVPRHELLQAVQVDPFFDVFRRLDVAELPPTIRQMFGAQEIVFVVPQENRQLWLEMAEFFVAGTTVQSEIMMAEDFRLLPSNKSVWIMGNNNPAAQIIANAVNFYGVGFSDSGLSLLGSELAFSNRSTVLTASHPDDPELTIGWIHAHSPEAMPGLTEKLPHYGRYSYLSFVGSEPTNDVKGQWESPNSPLQWRKPGLAPDVQLALLPVSEPLAELPPKYLPDGLAAHVNALTTAEMQGRGVGTEGIDRAAAYIAEQFVEIGLEAPGGSHLQTFSTQLQNGDNISLSNVIGVLPGTDESLKDFPIILGAHYDHLGMETNANGQQIVFAGADDNASGVGILIEIARKLQKSFSPKRSVIFVAFSGEESGLLGSRHFVANPPAPFTTQNLFAMINLDSVGRLEGRTLQVFASDSAYEWPFMAQGIGFTIGVPSEFPAQSVAGSDHVSFLEAGVPAIHLFSGLHADYHRSSDTSDKVDLDGMSDIALWVEEAMVYLAGRDQPLRVNLANAPVREATAPVGARAASLGTIPEFNYSGEGVQISGVTPGGAGEEAGLQAGDVLLQYNGAPIANMQEYSNLLRESAPGDEVQLQIRRNDELLTVDVVLKAR
ncbi:MAG: M20/M25/M40 family metallo-hydrolase [Gammaproteobacteria bacterium]|nr:M20/M25/M40 family metallo-hydrolase [Gammaproteobacteria bacterium]MDP2347836.1 M20/M25/M40 family metallo-hydrolase [Gammaproteobacteria bacterium]